MSTLLLCTSANAAPKVVASIAPIHSLVSMVMGDVAEPELLLNANVSPHDFSLKPSDARAIQNADVVFWVGPALEAFLAKPLEALDSKDTNVALIDAKGLTLLDFRDGEKIAAAGAHKDGHEHEDDDKHEGEHDAKHEHDDDDKEKHEDKHEEAHGHEGHSHHGHTHVGDHDPHIWLDPHNAAVMLEAIAMHLEGIDPENAETYRNNAQNALIEIQSLETKISAELSNVGKKSFVAFHDGTQYFEARFGLNAKGLLLDNPEVSASAARMKSLREVLQTEDVACIFSETQFNSDVTATLTEGLNVKVEVLDPLGAGIETGAGLYGELLTKLTGSFQRCLS
ncbi:zinc ABC transporter substrate-binding protein [Ahrensia sp. 13_GOM-1096m]|uniref:zinc ABC transporter substrate-binding protein n=1 Tax=Ahrensia sp. 13_GOM-1096m TaxID=1380380 RepID=UPI00138B112D|nr:zinc ABC transporter substrate-binding protein [Ahrensia sp. 13_GOM-1096m]